MKRFMHEFGLHPIALPMSSTSFIRGTALILLLVVRTVSFAQTDGTDYFGAGGGGIEVSIWKPSSLDAHASQAFKTVPGSDVSFGLFFFTPSLDNFSLRIAIMQWHQRDLSDRSHLESVTLRHLSLDLVQSIVPSARISPYVSYGLAAIWSRERPAGGDSEKVPLDRAGYGVNVGAGVEISIQRSLGVGAEYQYLYAKFAKRVGLTDNYSGPKLTFRLMVLF